MILAGDFRGGVYFEMDGEVFQVIEFQHVKPGKGAAFVRTKYKNIKTGAILERSFNPNDRFKRVQLTRQDMSYLYQDGELYYFMDNETFEQMPLDKEQLGEALDYLIEGVEFQIVSYQGNVLFVVPPTFVELEVIETEPGIRGDTQSSATKTAKVQTGAEIRVPLFINNGDVVKVDTRSGDYVERVR